MVRELVQRGPLLVGVVSVCKRSEDRSKATNEETD